MKFLRRQVLDRRHLRGNGTGAVGTDAAYSSIYTDIGGEVVIDSIYNLTIPQGPSSSRSPDNLTFQDGMIRYNTTTNEFEGRQNGAWRAFRFKEPTAILFQTLSESGNLGDSTVEGDGSTIIFGPLNPDPFTYYSSIESGTTWNASQIAQNLLVLVENVVQLPGINFDIVQIPIPWPPGDYGGNPGLPMPNGTYLKFSSPVPANKQIHVFHHLGR